MKSKSYSVLCYALALVVFTPFFSQAQEDPLTQHYEEILFYERLHAKYPKDIDYVLALAKSYSNAERPNEAIQLYKLGLKLDPDRPEIPTRLAYAYLKANNLSASEKLFREILIDDPNNTDILMGLGLIEMRYGRFKDAEKYFDKTLKIDPKNELALTNLADIKVEQIESKNKSAKKGLNLQEKQQLRLAAEFNKQKDFEAAAEIYLQLLSQSPKDADLYLLLGNTYNRMQAFCQAIEIFQQGLQIKPDYNDLKDGLALSYLRLGTQAPHLWTHFQWSWNYPYMFYFIKEDISVRFNWNEIDISRCLFLDVLSQKPDDAAALAGLGRIAALEDNREEAESLLYQSLSIEPDGTALSYLAPLLASEGKYFSARNAYKALLDQDPCDEDLLQDYTDVIWRSDPLYGVVLSYSQENEQGPISATEKDWVARLIDETAAFIWSFPIKDRLKVFGSLGTEYIILKNLINHTHIYSVDVQQGSLGASWNVTPYTSIYGGLGFSSFSQYHSSTFHAKPGWYFQPFLTIDYARNHHHVLIETFADAPFVARDFTNEEAALVDRQFLRGFYEYNFGNRTLVGAMAANVWYINRIKRNQQQLASAWVQWGPPRYWQNIVFRYQFIYGRFNHITPDYYTYRFQTTHWVDVALSKAWYNNKLITDAGYGRAWQRGFEQEAIIAITPLRPFRVIHRQINAAYARVQLYPSDKISLTATATYTLDSFNYTTASITAKLEWLF